MINKIKQSIKRLLDLSHIILKQKKEIKRLNKIVCSHAQYIKELKSYHRSAYKNNMNSKIRNKELIEIIDRLNNEVMIKDKKINELLKTVDNKRVEEYKKGVCNG